MTEINITHLSVCCHAELVLASLKKLLYLNMTRGGCVYILTNKARTVLYIGVTNNIHRRMYEHKNRINPGFTSTYNCFYLLYFESFWSIEEAIGREKQLKRWHREWKWNLIKSANPEFKDLSSEWFDKDNNLIDMPL